MTKEIDNETKVIAILSGYIREINEGKDYLQTTCKTAEIIVKICTTPKQPRPKGHKQRL